MTAEPTPPRGQRIPVDPTTLPPVISLLDMRRYDPGDWPHVIPEVLPVGLVLVYGRPGVAKTTLSDQFEHCVAAGVPVAGYSPEEPGRCLVIDYEGGPGLAIQRSVRIAPFGKLDTDATGDPDDRIMVHTSWPGEDFGARLLELEKYLRNAGHDGRPVRLVRIDTLRAFLGPVPQGANTAQCDSDRLIMLNQMAIQLGVCIIMVHHPNRAGDVSGSVAVEGSVTALYRIDRKIGETDGLLLCVKNRVAAERNWPMTFDQGSGTWSVTDLIIAGQAATTGHQRAVIDWLIDHGPSEGPRIWAGVTAATGATVATIKNAITRLHGTGWIQRDSGGVWSLTPQSGATAGTCEVCHRPMTVVTPGQRSHPNCEPGPVEAAPRFRWGPGTIGAEVNGEPDDEPAPVVQLPPRPAQSPPAEAGFRHSVTESETTPGPADPAAAEPGWSGVRALVKAIDRSRMHPRRWIPPAGHARDTGDGQQRDAPQWQAAIAADRAMSSGYGWARPGLLDDYGPARLVVTFDRTQAYVSSIENVAIAPNVLRHHGPFDCDPRELGDPDPRRDGKPVGLAGIAVVKVSAWDQPGIPHPLGRRACPGDELTIPTNLLEGLWKLHRDGLTGRPVVVDSWLGRRNTSLFSEFAKEVRAERAKHVHGSPGDTAVKRASSAAISMMRSTEVTPVYRPDWHAAVLGESMFRWWIRAWGALRAGELLAGIGAVDEVSYLVPEGADPATWVPAGYVIGSQWGQVKRKPVMLPAVADLSGVDPARISPAEGHKHRVYVTGPVPVAAWVSGRA